jgi:hypothetical protein
MDHNEQTVCGIFGERDIGAVSKSRLVLAVSKQSKLIFDLTMELFCENPGHEFFRQYSDEEKIPLILERERRCSSQVKIGLGIKTWIRNKAIAWLVKRYVPVPIMHPRAVGRTKNTKRL